MNRLTKLFFERRGLTDEAVADMIGTGTLALPCLDQMCARLHEADVAGKRVVLFTDFDMDGIMSGVIGFAGLCELGFLASLHPSDPRNGYGMHDSDVAAILTQYPDAAVLMTGDVGIAEHGPIGFAASRGLEVLVTDHHVPDGYVPVQASCCVDPMLAEDGSGRWFTGICGAHVMYLVLRRYAELYRDAAAVRQMDRLRVFAGIATVADGMPVYHENRQLIMDAVSITQLLWANGCQDVVNLIPGCDVYRRALFGVYAACEKLHAENKLACTDGIDETFFGFYLVPLFNSLKRMDQGLDLAYDVFFGGPAAAAKAMDDLWELNEKRKRTVADSFSAMMADDCQPGKPYVYQTDAAAGLRGLLAQNVMSESGLPAVVVGPMPDGRWRGSGRSPDWFPFLTELSGEPWCHVAGHQSAFGITLDGDGDIERLAAVVAGKCGEVLSGAVVTEAAADLRISTLDPSADSGVDIDLFMDFLREMDMYRPFGPGFEEPDVELEFRTLDARWMTMGKEKQHVKAILPMGFSVLLFNKAGTEKYPVDGEGNVDTSRMDGVTRIKGTLGLNRYMGHESVQFLARR